MAETVRNGSMPPNYYTWFGMHSNAKLTPAQRRQLADGFVLASGGENFGLVAAEAASVGTPVILSDRTGIAASFQPGEALVVPYAEQATVDAIARVLEDPSLRSTLAEGALRAARRTTWDAVVDAQLGIYEEALGARY